MKDIKLKFTDKLEENQLAQEINSIEEINNPVIIEEIKEEEITPTPEPTIEEPIIERPKNTVRIMDGNFPF